MDAMASTPENARVLTTMAVMLAHGLVLKSGPFQWQHSSPDYHSVASGFQGSTMPLEGQEKLQ